MSGFCAPASWWTSGRSHRCVTLSALSVEATFDTTPPDMSRVPGVSAVEVDGNRVRCHVQGTVEPLLKVLAASGVHEMLSREPSLEELFLAHYGAAGDARP